MAMLPGNYSINLTYSLLACMLAASSLCADEKLDFKGEVEIFGGFESNIFRNTHDMHYAPSLGGQSYDPVTSDVAGGGALEARAALNLNRINKLMGMVKADYQAFPRYSHANQGEAEGELEYRLRPNRVLSFRLPVSAGYVRKLGIDESVDETNLNEYWTVDAAPRVEIRPSEKIDFEGRYQFSWLDYRNADTVPSFDNTQNEISLLVEPHFGRNLNNSIGVECAYLYKSYRELGSYDDTGAYYDAPLRSYHYVTLELSYKHDFGPVTLKIAYRPRYRSDLFEGFYSYIENRLYSRISAELKSRTSFAVDGAWRYRHYLVHTAAQPGNGSEPDLVMHYIDFSAGVEQPIGKLLSLFIEYKLNLRNTNTTVLYFHTYRDYTDNLAKAGMRFSW